MDAIKILQLLAAIQTVVQNAPAFVAAAKAILANTDEADLRKQVADAAAGNDVKKAELDKALDAIINS